MLDVITKAKSILEQEPPSIVTQADDWGECRIVDFGKGKPQGTEYFNCSLGHVNGRDYLFVRRSRFDAAVRVGINDIVAFALSDFIPQLGYTCHVEKHAQKEHGEDPRFFIHKGQPYLSACTFEWFSHMVPPAFTGSHQASWLMEERQQGDVKLDNRFYSKKRFDPVYRNNRHTNDGRLGAEKNWLFYSYKDKLHLLYESSPFTVATLDDNFIVTGETVTEYVEWEYGHIRGGSNPILHEGLMWTFFHSSRDNQIRNGKRRYFVGCLAFHPETFKIHYITKEPLLSGSTHDRWGADKPAVAFPGSAILRKEIWHLALGVNDLDSAIATISHRMLTVKLMASQNRHSTVST